MFLLLLFLLPPVTLAEQACFDISGGVITTNLSQNTDLNLTDKASVHIGCKYKGSSCFMHCISESPNNTHGMFNGPVAGCVDAELTEKTNGEFNFNLRDFCRCTIKLCEKSVILPLINSLDCPTANSKTLVQLLNIRDMCTELFSKNKEMRKAFIVMEKFLLHKIINITLLESGESKLYSFKSLALNVVKISEANLSSAAASGRIHTETPQLLPQNESSVPETWLPVDALQSISDEQRVVGLVSYMFPDQFKFAGENISSMVMRIELLGERRFENLDTPVEIIFNISADISMDNVSWLECRYFDEHVSQWKKDGCETDSTTYPNYTEVKCSCNHTTPFAVLVVREPIAAVHWRILSYITYIGCAVSAFFSALSITMYVMNRSHRLDHSSSIHASLSGALFLLNTSFLLSEWGATVKPDWVCVFIAAVIHYSLLCSFSWMAIEALHLYLMLIKVFNTYYKHYLIKLSVAGWGIPAIIVGIFAGVSDIKQFYGVAKLNVTDSSQANNICWIVDDTFFYGMNLGYFTLIFIFNTGILLSVAAGICKMKERSKPENPDKMSQSCRNSLTVMGLTCLLGTTWGLVFLGSGYVNYPILYLFCILNSVQGLFVFLWVCGSVRRQRRRAIENRISSMPMKTSETKSS